MRRWREAAWLAELNGLAVAREHLGSLDKVTQVARLGALVATSGDGRDLPKIALQDVFGQEKDPRSLMYGVACLRSGRQSRLK